MTGVCGAAIHADDERVATPLEAMETAPLEGPSCSKCVDLLVEELVEEEPLEEALERGYDHVSWREGQL